jgi:hypothetical protein
MTLRNFLEASYDCIVSLLPGPFALLRVHEIVFERPYLVRKRKVGPS